jgi:hypothetical protein
MRYRGIEYEIKMAAGANKWVWIVHMPRPKQGSASGTRELAALRARNVIDAWCYQNAALCEPPTSSALGIRQA